MKLFLKWVKQGIVKRLQDLWHADRFSKIILGGCAGFTVGSAVIGQNYGILYATYFMFIYIFSALGAAAVFAAYLYFRDRYRKWKRRQHIE